MSLHGRLTHALLLGATAEHCFACDFHQRSRVSREEYLRVTGTLDLRIGTAQLFTRSWVGYISAIYRIAVFYGQKAGCTFAPSIAAHRFCTVPCYSACSSTINIKPGILACYCKVRNIERP
jgi:hypothetical protein